MNTPATTPDVQSPQQQTEGGGVISPGSHLAPQARDPGLHFASPEALLAWEAKRETRLEQMSTMGDPKLDQNSPHAAGIQALARDLRLSSDD